MGMLSEVVESHMGSANVSHGRSDEESAEEADEDNEEEEGEEGEIGEVEGEDETGGVDGGEGGEGEEGEGEEGQEAEEGDAEGQGGEELTAIHTVSKRSLHIIMSINDVQKVLIPILILDCPDAKWV